jgi:transcription antitermination factor NusG
VDRWVKENRDTQGEPVAGETIRAASGFPGNSACNERRALATPSAGLDPWFALRVRPNYEKPVAATLRGKGLHEYLPLVRSQRQWSDRVKVLDLPVFPGYLFCRLNLEDRMPLVTTPGFLYIVGIGKTPAPIEESEILAIQSVLHSGLPVTPWPSLVVGQKVQLQYGPLRGLEGVLTKIASQHRIYVSVTLLQRSISVEVEPAWVRPLDPDDVIPSHRSGVASPSKGASTGPRDVPQI